MKLNSTTLLAVLVAGLLNTHTFAQDKISYTGTIEALACAAACGICCPTHSVVDTRGLLRVEVGNAFVDLDKFSDDGQTHQVSGYFYDTTGQCGIGECTLFTIEDIDQQKITAPTYDAVNEKLSIAAIVINNPDLTSYSATLSAPFNVDSAVEITEENKIPQSADCSAANAICTDGTACIAYFGIAGPQGPEFKTCEIPCSHPGAVCPLGQSCQTIADGPGQVCVVD